MDKNSYAAGCANHCPMSMLTELIYDLPNAEALTLGTGECAFYSLKTEFGDGRRNWAYELSDKELIFGDLSGVRRVVEDMIRPDKILVCIVTCVPSLMNFDFSDLEAEFPRLGIMIVPDFESLSESELAAKLNAAIGQKTEDKPCR